MVSRLTVKKSSRRYNETARVLPGTVFQYGGNTYVLRGQLTNGAYYYAYDGPDGKTDRFPAKKCRVVRTGGLAYV